MRTWPQPVRLTLTGPMFRYDRPQAGRYRQFWQFDVEVIGDPGPAVDAEIVELALAFLGRAGLADVRVLLNSIGDAACRPAYVERLTEYFRDHEAELPPVERERLDTNPLRLLDSKDERMAVLVVRRAADQRLAVRAVRDALRTRAGAPRRRGRQRRRSTRRSSAASTTTPAPRSSSTARARRGSNRRSVAAAAMTAWSSSSAARRPPASGSGSASTGWCSHSQRRASHRPKRRSPMSSSWVPTRRTPLTRLRVVTDLRRGGVAARADLAIRKLGKQLEGAAKDGAHFVVICGDEMEGGHVIVRDLNAGTQRHVAIGDLARELARARAQHRHGPPAG